MQTQLNKGDSLPEADHVLRYLRRKFVDRATNQIDGNAFLSRPAEHGGPSVNWMECFQGDMAARIEAIRRLKRIKYEKRARVARLNAGATKAYIRERSGEPIDFIYDNLEADAERGFSADPSHAYLSNIPLVDSPEGEAIGDLIVHCILESWAVQPDE